jgi:hypothetical protein
MIMSFSLIDIWTSQKEICSVCYGDGAESNGRHNAAQKPAPAPMKAPEHDTKHAA